MALKEHLHNNGIRLLLITTCFLLARCAERLPEKPGQAKFSAADISKIPDVSVADTDSKLDVKNGIYYFNGMPFSGFILGYYDNGKLKSAGSYCEGKQHGITKTWYGGGTLRDERNYKGGVGNGRHVGLWENGKIKFDFFYVNDRSEGIQKQWYPNGQLYLRLTYQNDVETGMQKGWRENGKLFANYEVKDGIRYGLQKTNLCYTLRNQQLKLK